MKYLNQIKELTEVGVDEDSEAILGFHGTSIEAIRYLAEFGALPTTGATNTQFHFCPKPSARYSTEYTETPYNEAKRYAQINAIRNKIIAAIKANGVRITKTLIEDVFTHAEVHHVDASRRWRVDEVARERIARALGMETEELIRFHEELISKQHGLVLGLSNEITELNPVLCDDLIVTVPQGLPIKFITGIEPEGQTEWNEIFKNDLANTHLLY